MSFAETFATFPNSVLGWLAIAVMVIFAMYIGAIALIGPSIAAHTILLIGVFFTADIFRRSRRGVVNTDFDQTQSGILSYDMQFKDAADGGARYDDVWGAPDTISRRPLHQG